MASFASFIGRVRPGRKTKSNIRSPQPTELHHPYASPDVVYITDHTYDDPATTSFDSTAKASASSSSFGDDLPPKTSEDSTTTVGTSLTPRRSRSPSPSLSSSRISSRTPSPSSPVRRTTPMKLSIDFSSGQFGEWIPPHLLDSGVYGTSNSNAVAASTSNVSGISGVSASVGGGSNVNGLRGDASSRLSRDTTGIVVDVRTVNENASFYDDEDDDDDDDEDVVGVNDEDTTEMVVAKLEGMDASTFLKSPQSHVQGIQSPPHMVPRKAAPSPIKIPRTSPQVQIIRSSTQSTNMNKPDHPPLSHPQSHPFQNQSSSNHNSFSYDYFDPYSYDSATNSASASAVSGTTLARALIGNTFVLSTDDRASRYRSGSALTRSDSATLPRGERGDSGIWNYHSPATSSTNGHWSYGIFYTGDKRISGTSDTLSLKDVLSPHEPMPANADAVYSPPKNPRWGADGKPGEASGSKKRLSTGSLGLGEDPHKACEGSLIRSRSANVAAVLGGLTTGVGAGPSNGHRISPISESSSTSPNPSTLSVPATVNGSGATHTPPSPNSNAPNAVHGPLLENGQPMNIPPPPPIPTSSGRSSPKRFSSATSGSGTSGNGPSTGLSSEFGGCLDYYEGLARSPDPRSEGQFDPYLEQRQREDEPVASSSSSPSDVTPSGLPSSSQNTVGAVGPSAPLAGQFRPVFSPISEESTLASGMTTPASELSSPHSASGGEFVVVRSPSGRRNRDSRPQQSKLESIGEGQVSQQISNLGSINERQPTSSVGDSPVLALPSHVFTRQRSGSAPAPIRVVRDSRDPRQYNLITESPGLTPGPDRMNLPTASSASGSTPTTGDSGEGEYATYPPNPYGQPLSTGQQTFPETPNLFSPMWSSAVPGTGRGRHSMDPVLLGLPPASPGGRTPPPQHPIGARKKNESPRTPLSTTPRRTPPVEVPQTPLPYSPPTSAGFPGADGRTSMSLSSEEFMPSLDHQMLLARAASTVNRNRHERQGSVIQLGGMERIRTVAPPLLTNYPPHPYADPELIPKEDEDDEEAKSPQPSWIEHVEPRFRSEAVSPVSSRNSENPSETSMSMYSQASPTTYSAQSHRRNDSNFNEEEVPPVPPLPIEPKYRSEIEESGSRLLSERNGYRDWRPSLDTVGTNDGDGDSHPLKMEAHLRENDMVGSGIRPSPSSTTLTGGASETRQPHPTTNLANISNTSIGSQLSLNKDLPDLPPASPLPSASANTSGQAETVDPVIETSQASSSSQNTDQASSASPSVQDLTTPVASNPLPSRLTVNVPLPPNMGSPVTAVPPPALIVPPPPPLSQTSSSSSAQSFIPPPPQPPFSIPERADSLTSELYGPDHVKQGRYPSIPSMGSPPPYDTLNFENSRYSVAVPITLTPGPSTSGSGSGSGSASAFSTDYRFTSVTGSPNPSALSYSQSFHGRSNSDTGSEVERRTALRSSTASNFSRKHRSRPPLPGGPRRPSGQGGPQSSRQRNGSVSGPSTPGSYLGVNSRLHASAIPIPLHSPRFQTPTLKWRGYTIEAAKWTFTSAELQAIVSGAIKLSAEASSIRLLRLKTVESEIPEEVRRLEMQRTDIKTRYKMMARKRSDILDALSSIVREDPSSASRLVEELRDISMILDRLAEDLHAVDEQLAQMESLKDVHNASALAMAIRKLNASFLKQMAANEQLRRDLEALEGERDDAWKQAEVVAGDYDRLVVDTPTSQSGSSQPQSNRSSRVLAMRKSSIRASKAGLRSSRASISSNRLSVASLSGTKSPFSSDDIPPVPPMPLKLDLITDIPRTSTTGISTEPNTATRAMIKAHEELCEMLGITMMDRPRRARSVGGSADVEKSRSPSRPQSSGGRPSSLPDSSRLTEAYHVMAADRRAMLATLGMLADEP